MAAVNGKSGRTAGGAKGGALKNSDKEGKTNAPIGSSKNASAKAAAAAVNVLDEPLVEYASTSKPDRELYNKEQEAIKAQLAVKQAQLVSPHSLKDEVQLSCMVQFAELAYSAHSHCTLQDKIKARIADSTGQGPAGEKRKQLRAEQAEIRSKTAGFKEGRNSAFNQIKVLQESVARKIKDINNAKSKTNYKSVEEIGTCFSPRTICSIYC